MFVPGSSLSVLCFEIVCAAVIVMVIATTRHAYRDDGAHARRITMRMFLGLLAWLGVLLALIKTEKLQELPMQGMPVFFISILFITIGLGFSSFGTRLATHTPIAALIAFQSFRLPIELILHNWSNRGTIPETMTWTGQNWDIVAGALAFVIWPLARNRAVAWGFNIIGSLLLLNVVRVAVMSGPLPFSWDVNPPLVLFMHAPYYLIGPVIVGSAILGHIVLTRALLRKA